MFKKNMGTTDRLIRLALAVLLVLFAWWQSSWIALGFGLFTLYEALAGWCILYQLLHKNTCPLQSSHTRPSDSFKEDEPK